jgi:hypothetical protein
MKSIVLLVGLVVQFLIVPEWLYISGGDLRVMEGDAVTLPESILAVLTEYYRGRVTEYRIVETPRAGCLQSPQEPGIPLHKFSTSQLKAGLIQVLFYFKFSFNILRPTVANDKISTHFLYFTRRKIIFGRHSVAKFRVQVIINGYFSVCLCSGRGR